MKMYLYIILGYSDFPLRNNRMSSFRIMDDEFRLDFLKRSGHQLTDIIIFCVRIYFENLVTLRDSSQVYSGVIKLILTHIYYFEMQN